MNFYSDEIINDIIDNKPLEEVIDLIEMFGERCFNLIAKYSYQNVNHKYIYNVLENTKNIVALYCLDIQFSLDNCPSILVYRKCKIKNEIIYYILIICTKRTFRNQGYATKLLDGLMERISTEMNKTTSTTQNVKIILSSVEESVIFYENYGFKWTRDKITEHPILLEFELFDSSKEYFIMEYVLPTKNT
jgi:GNAT superfamily N-acetyltransferase